MDKMIARQSKLGHSRLFGLRPRVLAFAIVLALTTCFVFFTRSADLRIIPYTHDHKTEHFSSDLPETGPSDLNTLADAPYWELNASDIKHWHDPTDKEDPNNIEPGTEQDGKDRGADEVSRLQDEKDKRKLWRYIYAATAKYDMTCLPI